MESAVGRNTTTTIGRNSNAFSGKLVNHEPNDYNEAPRVSRARSRLTLIHLMTAKPQMLLRKRGKMKEGLFDDDLSAAGLKLFPLQRPGAGTEIR